MLTNYQKEAADLLNSFGIKFSTKFIAHDFHFEEDKQTRDIFRVTFSRRVPVTVAGNLHQVSKRFSLRFGQSIANSGTAPDSYDVLSCLQKYDVGSFEDFCSEFGYDTDSRRAEKTYRAVVKEWKKVSAFFSPYELEAIQEIN